MRRSLMDIDLDSPFFVAIAVRCEFPRSMPNQLGFRTGKEACTCMDGGVKTLPLGNCLSDDVNPPLAGWWDDTGATRICVNPDPRLCELAKTFSLPNNVGSNWVSSYTMSSCLNSLVPVEDASAVAYV